MKFDSDRKRSEREFVVGDWVYLRLQPYRQATVIIRRNMKLAPRFFGPYQVLTKIGSMAYRIQLPISFQIHPVFYVSQLKKKVGDTMIPSFDLPKIRLNDQFLVYPVAVLARKMIKRHNQIVT